MIDLVIINPQAQQAIYQDLSNNYSAIEPPIWAGLLANGVRAKGFKVAIIDCLAEQLTAQQTAKKVDEYHPKLVALVIYGQQPSASTQNMLGASLVCQQIKQNNPEQKVIMIGGHVSALPLKTMQEELSDFICQGEGLHTLIQLLQKTDYQNIPGLFYRQGQKILHGPPSLPMKDLDAQLPGVAWDLLPMHAYRAHNWHCFDHLDERSPYASIYTSLGCPYNCNFCCINTPFGGPSFRYWSPEFTIKQIDELVQKYNIRNLKIADEMFVLKEKHFLKLCQLIIERDYQLNIWAYARIDTVKKEYLEQLKQAGVNWLVLGIESKSQFVRSNLNKGKFKIDDIYQTVKRIQDAGIYVHGNFIFGLPDDDLKSMSETFELAQELNCEMANFYCAMAYPGSHLYQEALDKKWPLPSSWDGYSQHSYNCLPLPSNHLSAAEILRFRDNAWQKYFTSEKYLTMIKQKFGFNVVEHLQTLASHHLTRKILQQS